MRYIGNKEKLLEDIYSLLESKGLLREKLTFFDAFSGTGSVADYLSNYFKIVVNDIMEWSVSYTRGRLVSDSVNFYKLGFDPIEFLNENETEVYGFFYNNYSLGNSERMYFTKFNAARIDFFREQIQKWYNDDFIDDDEFHYLIACLLESVSTVSNTAGVYGAYLKKWDNRAIKKIKFIRVPSTRNQLNFFAHENLFLNDKVENIIDKVDCDILYLDPPYTQNQYGTQYHLLETLYKYDNPEISKITGSRSTSPYRSDWSKDIESHVLFDQVLSKTTAKYIILSYSSDGFMSKQFIEASMKRYGKEESFDCVEINYNRYNNWKSIKKDNHSEYLFFIEMKDKNDIYYESPLNYIGSKYRYMTQIKPLIGNVSGTFYDLFGGGFNVGINIEAKNYIYNDINHHLVNLMQILRDKGTSQNIKKIRSYERKFSLEPGGKEQYLEARKFYNDSITKDPLLLFTIILYGFNQQIRFNNKHEFNNPAGIRWFNDNVLEKFISFSRRLKEIDVQFKSKNYSEFLHEFKKNDFIYLDPPYLLTLGSYNDGRRGFKGWNEVTQTNLLEFIDELDEKERRFMLSYVKEHRDKENHGVKYWLNKNKYVVREMSLVPGKTRKELVIVNYDI